VVLKTEDKIKRGIILEDLNFKIEDLKLKIEQNNL
jgi:hypothetical protein